MLPQVRLCDGLDGALVQSMAFAERIRGMEPALGETFITFAKVSNMRIDKWQAIAERNVKYGKALYNATMHKTVLALSTVVTDKTHELLMQMDFLYGKDFLSSSYNKLSKWLGSAQKLAESDRRSDSISVQDAAMWLLESLQASLLSKRLTVKAVTIESLDKHPKTSAPGYFQVWNCRSQAGRCARACGFGLVSSWFYNLSV